MGKKSRRNRVKTEPTILDKFGREQRVRELRQLLEDEDLWHPERFLAVGEFEKICNDFIENGETREGKIAFPEFNRTIYYLIPRLERHHPVLHLLWNGGKPPA